MFPHQRRITKKFVVMTQLEIYKKEVELACKREREA